MAKDKLERPVGQINIFGIGGAGIRVTSELEVLYGTMDNVNFNYIDTSDNNIKELSKLGIDSEGKFHRVEDSSYTGKTVSGSAGEIGKHLDAKKETITALLDKMKLKSDTSIFNIIIYGISGGSGASLGPILTSSLLERGVSIIPIVIGDDSDVGRGNNTLSTIGGLFKMVTKFNRSLVVSYYNNHLTDNKDELERRKAVNEGIIRDVSVLITFMSGINIDVDSEDIVRFLSLNYKENALGLYTLDSLLNVDEYAPINGTVPLITRTLVDDRNETLTDLLQDVKGKVGFLNKCSNPSLFETKKDNEVRRLDMIIVAGVLVHELGRVKDRVDKLKAEEAKVTSMVDAAVLDDIGDEEDLF